MAQGARGGWKPEFIFEGDEEREQESKNLSDDQLLTEATLDDGTKVKVYETDRAYICPEMASDKQKGGTRISKEILKKELPREQIIKLFVEVVIKPFSAKSFAICINSSGTFFNLSSESNILIPTPKLLFSIHK